VDTFIQHKKYLIAPSDIELYPEGFIPFHLISKLKKISPQKNINTEEKTSNVTDKI
jgi:hypothetical protein